MLHDSIDKNVIKGMLDNLAEINRQAVLEWAIENLEVDDYDVCDIEWDSEGGHRYVNSCTVEVRSFAFK